MAVVVVSMVIEVGLKLTLVVLVMIQMESSPIMEEGEGMRRLGTEIAYHKQIIMDLRSLSAKD